MLKVPCNALSPQSLQPLCKVGNHIPILHFSYLRPPSESVAQKTPRPVVPFLQGKEDITGRRERVEQVNKV